MEEYRKKKQAIKVDNHRYTFAPIPEKKKADCMEKDNMRRLIRKLRYNYRDNKVIDRTKPTFQSKNKLKGLLKEIAAIRSGNYIVSEDQ